MQKFKNIKTEMIFEVDDKDLIKNLLTNKDFELIEDTSNELVEKPIERMNKAELVEKATELALEFDEKATNKELIELIKTALTPKGE